MRGSVRSSLRRLRRKRFYMIPVAVLSLFVMCIVLDENMWKVIMQSKTTIGYIYENNYFHVAENDAEMREMIRNQKCKIPIINPFNPEILPMLRKSEMVKCRVVRYGVVKGGMVRVKAEDVLSISLYYINRVDDFKFELSQRVSLLDHWEGDVDIEHPLKAEFFKLRIQFKETVHVEYHAAILKSPEEEKKEKEKENDRQPSIIVLIFDSVSNAHAQRSLKKSYKYLTRHPRTTIMMGHSIVGDGTTAQLTAMLTGVPESQLPEARRGKNYSKSVDDWPFIFKDMHKLNYKTVYAEEYQYAGTFQYRLKGFIATPTTHYLGALWLAMQDYQDKNGVSCAHKFHFDYLDTFMNAYKHDKKFAVVLNELSHNSLYKLENADADIVKFYEAFERSPHANNTVIIIMGDHGLRTSKFRATLHGKLEERLPLMAITLPPFFDEYPEEVKNLKRNANLMTSHFDTYATLQHLLTFPHLNANVVKKYGKSLFTDISKLNRTCDHAGVDKHWCTCLNYEHVNESTDPNVWKLASNVLVYMNELTSKQTNGMCSTLTLRTVTRAGRRTSTTEVNQFVNTETARNGCDSCEVKYNTHTKLFHRYEYEIHFSVEPSGATFEALGEVIFKKDGGITIMHSTDISRTNRYGNQPRCLGRNFPHLRKFCYCTQNTTKNVI